MINLKDYTKEFKYNLNLATPVIMGMLGHTLVGFVDTMMVGKLGTTELAAVSLGNSIIFLAMSFGIGFSTAITTLAGEADGENNKASGKSVLKHGIILCFFISLFLSGMLFFSKELMIATKQQANVIELAFPYIKLVAISLIPMMVFQAFKQFADGYSLTKYSMYTIFVGNSINVVLNYIFIYGNFGFPKMGVEGAAVGTLASRFVMPFLMWYFLSKNDRIEEFVHDFKWRFIDFDKIRTLVKIGGPSSLQMVFEAGVFIAANWICGAIGENYQAAHQIALTMSSTTFMISSGMSVVATIRVSRLKGAKDFLSLRRIALSVYLFVVGNQVIMAIIYALFKNVIPLVFLDTSPESMNENTIFVINQASVLLIIAGIFQIPDGIQVVSLGVLRGIQDVKRPMTISFISYWLVAFTLSYYLGLYTPLKAVGVWIGLMAGLVFAAVLLYIRFDVLTKKLIKENK